MSPSRPDGSSSFDELLLEDVDAGTASAAYSFEKRSTSVEKASSQDYPTVARFSLSGQAPGSPKPSCYFWMGEFVAEDDSQNEVIRKCVGV